MRRGDPYLATFNDQIVAGWIDNMMISGGENVSPVGKILRRLLIAGDYQVL